MKFPSMVAANRVLVIELRIAVMRNLGDRMAAKKMMMAVRRKRPVSKKSPLGSLSLQLQNLDSKIEWKH